MEAQGGTASVSVPPRPGWIVSPAFDLLFLANVGWVAALVPGFVSEESTRHIEFWQIYFLSAPHRWITLFLVTLDPDRREGRTWVFVLLALLAAGVVGGVWLSTGALTCLGLVNYVWNGWHFAAQHFGVLRMYSRKAGGGRPILERWGLRLFIFYVILRTAGWSTGWLEDSPDALALLFILDGGALCIPVLLMATALYDHGFQQPGRLVYAASVCSLYGALLWALQERQTMLVLALTTASATFHAVEYLAIVTHYAWRRRHTGSAGLFRAMAGRWTTILIDYAVLLGLFALMIERGLGTLWLGMDLCAAFLHYTYDGMIWKLRRPATAQAMGV